MQITFGTKAEVLSSLEMSGFNIPEPLYFTVAQWSKDPYKAIRQIYDTHAHSGTRLAVRSSAKSEDGAESSQAGAFQSLLHIPSEQPKALIKAIVSVADHLHDPNDQILIQPMVQNVQISGVAMTRVLDDGSPYYVINYDDCSGRTDTITSGQGANKVVYIYRGAHNEDFTSLRLHSVVELIKSLESLFKKIPLDIEFAVDDNNVAHLLQVRRICSKKHWHPQVERWVEKRIAHVEHFVKESMSPRTGLLGKTTSFGLMPDWNPAEMIGVSPRPLALSLYRELITKKVWRTAREHMGYRSLPPVELMVEVCGRPFIDIRASFNSFLPDGLSDSLGERLVGAFLERLDANPSLHDKVEFEIVPTAVDCDFEEQFIQRYPSLLTPQELEEYKQLLLGLTQKSLQANGTLHNSLKTIDTLHEIQKTSCRPSMGSNLLDCCQQITTLIEDCTVMGTLPFAIIARHAFIAEAILRSCVRVGALTSSRLEEFKRSVKTISGELTKDFSAVCNGEMQRDTFFARYGHLRPGTYDILSPCYSQRSDLFEAASTPQVVTEHTFTLTYAEEKLLNAALDNAGLNIQAERLLAYADQAIAGREYAKFVFTRHVSDILELVSCWGKQINLSLEQLSMLPIHEITGALFTPLHANAAQHYIKRVQENQHYYEVDRSFKLSYLIRSPKDVYIVPLHRGAPNFITGKRLEAPIVTLDIQSTGSESLHGCIVCIESADPGYDWIFTRGIAGLVTRYGGANSHMAIRCAEYGLPAAIGCGEQLFDQVASATRCVLDCSNKTITPVFAGGKEQVIC